MKKLVLIINLAFLSTLCIAQSGVVRGIVKLQNSGAKPLPNAQISAFGASPVYSNSSGMYEMNFNSKKPGATVSLMVSADGYEVINEKELEHCVIRQNPDDLIFIIMAKQGQRNKQALAYYNIIVGNTNQNYDKELKNINTRLNSLAADDSERDVLLTQIDELQKEKETLLNQAEELAKQLATVDLDRASNLANEAYQKFQNGDVKAALTVLDDETLDKDLKDSKAELEKLKKKVAKADSAFTQSVENYMIKARFCITDGQYKAAYKNYLKAVEADSTNLENIIELADFCDNIHDQKRAIRFYEQAYHLTTSTAAKAHLLIELGVQYRFEGDYEKAEMNHKNALKTALPLIRDTLTYLPIEARVQNELAIHYQNLNELEKAKSCYLKAFEIYSILAKNNPEEYEIILATSFSYLSGTYFSLGNTEKAINLGSKAIEILSRLAEKSEFYKVKLAEAKMSLGNIYMRINYIDKAPKELLGAYEIYQGLSANNPRHYEPDLVRIQSSLGNMYRNLHNFPKADSIFLQALETTKRLAAENPVRFEPELTRIYTNLAGVQHFMGNLEKEGELLNKVLEIRRRLVKRNPQRFNLDLVRSLINMIHFNKTMALEELDLKYKEEAMDLLKETKLVLATLDSTLVDVQKKTYSYQYFKDFFSDLTEDDLKAEAVINQCKIIESKQYNLQSASETVSSQKEMTTLIEDALIKYPNYENLRSYGSETYGNLGWLYIQTSQFKEAEKAIRRGIEMDKDSQNEWLYAFLAHALLFQDKYQAAQKIYLEMKDKPDINGTYKNGFLREFELLENNGVTHKDVAKIRELLK